MYSSRELACWALWAVRAGLIIALYAYLTKSERVSSDGWSGALVVVAALSATFVPRGWYEVIKTNASLAFINFAAASALILIAFSSAVAALILNENVIPGIASLLREWGVSTAWVLGLFLFLVVTNAKYIYQVFTNDGRPLRVEKTR